jgi:DNA invertase Pin-like site-specific DNA recombinase
MISKIQDYHKTKLACIYLRQSTMGQVRFNQESTERQYALKDKALQLGWSPHLIKVLDGDLGISGTQSSNREDFKTLVAEVSLAKVGAVFALEASRLSRSCTDWHRLLELCSLAGTLIIDEDGCYNPADFNDQLLLGLKGTMSQAELHFIRARLQGGKINKAKKGELRFPLPVGLSRDKQGNTVLDPDEEIRHAVQLLFSTFKECGSAFGVVQHFTRNHIKFPKRSYGGVWNGKVIWSEMSHARIISIIKNPAYAGTYVYGRFKYRKKLSEDGKIQCKVERTPLASWQIAIQGHHEGYIKWDEYLENQKILERNRTNGEATMTSNAVREGLALLQGLLLCGSCGYRLSVRYTGNGGIHPVYECTHRGRDGIYKKECIAIRSAALDKAVSQRILAVITPVQLEIAINALKELECRNNAIDKQWKMKIDRAEYESKLAQRSYEEVDPSNRLVAATLEKRWEYTLVNLEEFHTKYAEYQEKEALTATAEQRANILSLGQDLPRLWVATTTKTKDRKRILRLLIKDITVDKFSDVKNIILHIRWQGGAQEDIAIERPVKAADKWRCPQEIVDKIRELSSKHPDEKIIEILNSEGIKSGKEKNFTISGIQWVRFKYSIPSALSVKRKQPHELTVNEVAMKFGVSQHVVFYWINRGYLDTRQIKAGSPHLITMFPTKEQELCEWVKQSSRIKKMTTSLTPIEGGAL